MRDMDEAELRRHLLSYPDITEANIEDHLRHYTMRAIQKQTFLARGFSNAMAERGLDKLGYQRPPGWQSVFFYPGSMRPRNRYVLLGIVIVTAVILNGCVAWPLPEQG